MLTIVREKQLTPVRGFHFYEHYVDGRRYVEGNLSLPKLRLKVWDYRGFTMTVTDQMGETISISNLDASAFVPFVDAIPDLTWKAFRNGLIDHINVAKIQLMDRAGETWKA